MIMLPGTMGWITFWRRFIIFIHIQYSQENDKVKLDEYETLTFSLELKPNFLLNYMFSIYHEHEIVFPLISDIAEEL